MEPDRHPESDPPRTSGPAPEPAPELLRGVVTALDLEHQRAGTTVPRLYGVRKDGGYVMLDEGDPYRMLELFTLLPDETYAALAIVCSGWASPMGEGRPSRHPARERIRSVTAVAASGDEVTLLRRAGRVPELMEGGEGALLDALRAAATTLAGPAGAPTAA